MARERRFDVVVVGAGPAGLAAAGHAGAHGRTVALVDEQPAAGGQIWRRDRGTPDPAARRALARARSVGAAWLPGHAVVDATEDGALALEGPDGVTWLRGDRIVLATGARERHLPFPGSTLPAVTGAGGLQALMKGGLDVAGEHVLVAGSGPLLLAVAATLRRRGAHVTAVLEQARLAPLLRLALGVLASQPGKLAQLVRLRAALLGASLHHDAWPLAVREQHGRLRVDARVGAHERSFVVDRVAVGFGLVPETRLAQMLGCAVEDGRVVVDAFQRTSQPDVLCAGEPTGVGGVEKALAEGTVAGLAAAGAERRAHRHARAAARGRAFARALDRAFALRPELRAIATPSSILCRCEDVRMRAVSELPDARTAKLLTRCGMGACQGRVCGDALAFLRGWSDAPPRPPLLPVTVGDLARAWSPTSLETGT